MKYIHNKDSFLLSNKLISESTIIFTDKFDKILKNLDSISDDEWGYTAKTKDGKIIGLDDIKKMIVDINNLKGKDVKNSNRIVIDIDDKGEYITYTTMDIIRKEFGDKYDSYLNGDINGDEYTKVLRELLNDNILETKRRTEKLSSFLFKLNIGTQVSREEFMKKVKSFGTEVTKNTVGNNIELKVVEGNDIMKYYSSDVLCKDDNVSSCMLDSPSVMFYAKNNKTIKLIVVINENDELLARALLFYSDNGDGYVDTIYSGESVLARRKINEYITENNLTLTDDMLDNVIIECEYLPKVVFNPQNVDILDVEDFDLFLNKYSNTLKNLGFSVTEYPSMDTFKYIIPNVGISNEPNIDLISYDSEMNPLEKLLYGYTSAIDEMDNITTIVYDYLDLGLNTENESSFEWLSDGVVYISKALNLNENNISYILYNTPTLAYYLIINEYIDLADNDVKPYMLSKMIDIVYDVTDELDFLSRLDYRGGFDEEMSNELYDYIKSNDDINLFYYIPEEYKTSDLLQLVYEMDEESLSDEELLKINKDNE